MNNVEHPSHYAEGRKYEPIDVINDWRLNFNLGNTIKYISRAGRKNNIIEDLKKAKFYLDYEIKRLMDMEEEISEPKMEAREWKSKNAENASIIMHKQDLCHIIANGK